MAKKSTLVVVGMVAFVAAIGDGKAHNFNSLSTVVLFFGAVAFVLAAFAKRPGKSIAKLAIPLAIILVVIASVKGGIPL